MGTNTPWGYSQSQQNIAGGITSYSTASHGGIKLSDERNALVHEAWRDPRGWYEEDCDAHIPALTFVDEFTAAGWFHAGWTVAESHQSAKDWLGEQYEQVYDVKLTASESTQVAEREFYQAHAGDYLTMAAWGDWQEGVDAGMVGVFACVDGRRGDRSTGSYFLVPQDEYDGRSQWAFVIDPQRHRKVADFTGSGRKTKAA